MSVQRWSMAYTNDHPDNDGKWVRYADHVAVLAEATSLAYAGGAFSQPRTLTADDPEPGDGSVVLDPDGDAWQRVGDPDGHTYWYSTFGWRGDWTAVPLPARLIHDEGQACECGGVGSGCRCEKEGQA